MNPALDTQVIIIKALRSSFNQKQQELLKETFWDDTQTIIKVREMQAEYKEFEKFCKELKESNRELYEQEILGLR